jgi:hypothetical protein
MRGVGRFERANYCRIGRKCAKLESAMRILSKVASGFIMEDHTTGKEVPVKFKGMNIHG